jgi:hypothetical protein
VSATIKPLGSNWASVYASQRCIGHVLARGKHGFEAFDNDDKSIGIFANVSVAADALTKGF